MNSPADEIIPPVSLGYLASTVLQHHHVTILDCLKEDKNSADMRNIARDYDCAGITLFTKDITLCRQYLQVLKEANPRMVTVVGGPHPSAVPLETMQYFGDLCDYAFAGEAEVGLPKLLAHLSGAYAELSSIEGLCYRENGVIKINPGSCPAEIEAFSVAWDLIPPDTYPEAPHGAFYRQFPIAPVITSRGCPFHCTFCGGHIISGRKMRQRSVANVIDEISMLYQNYGVREIHIEDDNFTAKKSYVLEFCAALKKRCPEITWTCPNGVRIDTLDREMLMVMKDAGCYGLSFGIESGNNDTLKAMKKSLTVEKIQEKITMMAGTGIDINAFFILGYPGETRAHIENTIRFALSLPLKRASFANFQPLPGTEAFHYLIDNKILAVDHWDRFNPSLQSTIWSPPGLTVKDLAWYRRKALLKFYLRPRILYDFFRGIKNRRHFFYIFRRAFRWLTFTGRKQ